MTVQEEAVTAQPTTAGDVVARWTWNAHEDVIARWAWNAHQDIHYEACPSDQDRYDCRAERCACFLDLPDPVRALVARGFDIDGEPRA